MQLDDSHTRALFDLISCCLYSYTVNCLPPFYVVVCYAQSPSIDNIVIHSDELLEDEIVCDVEFRYIACTHCMVLRVALFWITSFLHQSYFVLYHAFINLYLYLSLKQDFVEFYVVKKSFSSLKAHRVSLISVLWLQQGTSLHCETTDTGLVYCTVCLFTSQLLLVLIAPTHEGMARLSWPGWLVTCRNSLPICRWSPVQILTGSSVD